MGWHLVIVTLQVDAAPGAGNMDAGGRLSTWHTLLAAFSHFLIACVDLIQWMITNVRVCLPPSLCDLFLYIHVI